MKYMPRWAVLLLDIILCLLAYLISYLTASSIFQMDAIDLSFGIQLLIVLLVQTMCFGIFHTYSGILRYSTFTEVIKIMLSVLLTVLLLALINVALRSTVHYFLFLNTALFVYFFIAFVFLFSLRIGVKTLFETVTQNSGQVTRVMIYGTKAAGVAIAKMLRSGNTRYKPICFIDDDPKMRPYDLLGLKVYPLNEATFETLRSRGVNTVIVSPLKMQTINPAVDLDVFLNHNIKVMTTPLFSELEAEGNVNHVVPIEEIKIEDLLERQTIKVNLDNVKAMLKGKVVLVSGAAGSIGSELVRQIIEYKPQLIVLLDQAESPLHDLYLDLHDRYPKQRIVPCIADVRNRERVEEAIDRFRPEIIYHAAAYKHVPLMESHPVESIEANVLGTKNMADMAVKYGVKRFVMISTDKAVNPTNIMGASKRIAEIYVQSLNRKLEQAGGEHTKFITTRFGNVLGSNGSVIPYFKKQIAAGGPVTVTHPDIIRYFMTIPEACWLVLEAGTLGDGGEIFIFDMGSPVKIVDLAKKMIRLAGFTPNKDIQIVYTGLRPGEKLYEELLNQKETTLPTDNPKIMRAKVQEFAFDDVAKEIDKLFDYCHQHKSFLVVQQMKRIVPEYISKNSPYEELD